MARKKINSQAPLSQELPTRVEEAENQVEEPQQVMKERDQQQKVDPDERYQLIIEKGIADKLSPKSTGKIYFQLAVNLDDSKYYLRIDSNDGGGLHSREWIDIQFILDAIGSQADNPFKSTLLKPCMKGKSANNLSFLAGILRSEYIGLIKASDKSQFLHVLADDFEAKAKTLIELTSPTN